MRVLLVNANRCRDLLPPPPIGLAYVASAAQAAGHDVRLADLLLAARPEVLLQRALREHRPDVVGVSARNLDTAVAQCPRDQVGELAGVLATLRAATSAPLVAGGPAVSLLGPAALRSIAADYAVVGEGETTFVELLAALEDGRPKAGIPGLAWREGSEVRGCPPRPGATFGPSGMERWIDWRPYERSGGTWAVQSKRGCPLLCAYCAYGAIEGRTYRLREPAEVAAEVERVARTVRPRAFEVVDSTFNLPRGHAVEVCEAIARLGLRLALTTEGINPLGSDEALFAAMRRAGFNSMMVSPEAGCDAMLERLHKGFGMDDVHRTAALARRSGMVSLWFFMLGGPGETRETVEATLRFVEERLDWPGCLAVVTTGVRVLPGTEVERVARAEGVIAPDADLARPTFYLPPGLDEAWVLERVNRAVARRPTIVHAAEEEGSPPQRWLHRVLYLTRVAPPFWRFLPAILRSRPMVELRRRRPPVGSRPAES